MTQKQNKTGIALAICGLFFFAIGFALGINGFLTPVLKGALDITPVVANLLIAFNFVPFLLFGYPATVCISKIGYKATMAVSFALFAIAFGLFVPAAKFASLPFFLVACFISGAANAVLQACVNPYITILGPLESAAKRTSIMGICNKLAWPTTTVFMTLVIGKGLDDIQMADLFLPFYIIIGIFVLLGIIALLAPLPEVKAAGEDEDDAAACPYAEGKTSIMQFPHLLLGCLALFFYVGVETISLATVADYATSLNAAAASLDTDSHNTPCLAAVDSNLETAVDSNLVVASDSSLAVTEDQSCVAETDSVPTAVVVPAATGEEKNGLFPPAVLALLGYIPSLGMVLGYLCGIFFIPKYLSQDKAMRICAWIALVGSVLVAVLPGQYSIYCIFLMALGCSLMWPALWPLAMADLGKFTKQGAALLTMAIAGGAVMPLVRAWVEGMTGSFQASYWVCVPCFLVILLYGSSWYKIRK